MVTRVVILFAVIAVASSASVGEHVACCGPTEWEAMAIASAIHDDQSGPISGRLSVDHKQQLVKLSLIKMEESMNSTMVMSTRGGSLFIYFIIERQDEQEPQPECVAYVLKNMVPDISSSCFPAKQSQAPMNVLAYEYAGLAGLFVLQAAANADDCTPTMLSMSTGASSGPQLNVILSNIIEGNSDQSADNLVRDACAGVTPMNIMVPNNGRFENRRGSMDPMRSSNDFNPQQWIADMVTMYIVQMIGSNSSPRSPLDLMDMLALQELMNHPSAEEVMESALKLEFLMQNVSDFVSLSNDNSTTNDSLTLQDIIESKITLELISRLMSRLRQGGNRDENLGNNRDNSRGNSWGGNWDGRDDSPGNRGADSRADGRGDRRDDRDNRREDRRDERDGSDTFNILINQHIISKEESVDSEGDSADINTNLPALISRMINQKLGAKVQPVGESGPVGTTGSVTKNEFLSSLKTVLSSMIQGKSSWDDPQNELSQSSQDTSRHAGHDDDSTSVDEKIIAMIKQYLASSMMNDKSRKDGPQRQKRNLRDMMSRQSDDSSSIDDLVALMIKQEILSSVMQNNDSRKLDLWEVMALMNKQGDRNIDIGDVVAGMTEQKILSSIMQKDGGKLDLWDVLALMNKENDRNIDIGDVVVGMVKKEILTSIMQDRSAAGETGALDDLVSLAVKKSIISSLESN